jgi:hypothetical protein
MAPLNCTFVSIPKAFSGHFGIIQTNAIRSWTLLQPRPEIILFGDDPGTAEIARELQLRHEPQVERNEFGTPLVSGIFGRAQQMARHDLVCYINADIILTRHFMGAIEQVPPRFLASSFLMVGRKQMLDLPQLLDFSDPAWEQAVVERARAGVKFGTSDSDYFIFPKGMYENIPPFAVGRCFWSPWFVWEARRQRIPVIDATAVIPAVESCHDYSHAASTGHSKKLGGPEYESNRRLFRGCKYLTTLDATLQMTSRGLRPAPASRRLASLFMRAEYALYFLAKRSLPYSWPLIWFYRATRRLWNAIDQSLFTPAAE